MNNLNTYTEQEVGRLIDASLAIGSNLMPYVNNEMIGSLYLIKSCFKCIKHYNIRPEVFWHGDVDEYECFLVLMESCYPNKEELLAMAKKPTNGAFRRIRSHFFQTIEVMFDHFQVYKGYDVLKPSEFMLFFHPDAQDKLYVYPHECWVHNSTYSMSRPFLVIREDAISQLPALMKNKIGITT